MPRSLALLAALALGAAPLAALAQDAAAPAETTETAEAAPIAIPDMTIGAEDAPVTVVEYGSFTCPHCAAWHEEVWPEFKANYIDTGKVRFTFREVYFDRFGLWASMIARCGGEMRFFGIHDVIYQTQRDWIGDGEPAAIAENLRAMGRTAGLSDAALDACLSDEAQARALVDWYTANSEADGVEATPTFIVDGEKFSGEMPYDEFAAKVDAHLADAPAGEAAPEDAPAE